MPVADAEHRWTFTDMLQAFPTLKPVDDNVVAEINISLDHIHGGTAGEFTIRWYDLVAGQDPVPRLMVFEDGWPALEQSGLIAYLAGVADGRPSVADDKQALLQRGFVDRTGEYNPSRCIACGAVRV